MILTSYSQSQVSCTQATQNQETQDYIDLIWNLWLRALDYAYTLWDFSTTLPLIKKKITTKGGHGYPS